MKANELMIGDWMYDTILKGNTRVEMLSSCGIGGDFHDNVWNEKTFNPITLTAEILEKNGFKKFDFREIEGQHQWSWWRDTLTSVTLWMRELNDNPTDGWMIRIESTPVECCLKISSVHELQHALRLCGIEKEIML